ncbi:MAG TPA: hypothetical protein VI279_13975 [Rhodocyclaceae bacterium]
MNATTTRYAAIALTAGAIFSGSALAASGDDAFNRVAQHYAGLRQPGFVNAYMPHGTGQYAAESAEKVLAGILIAYTRELLDRSGWVNPWVSAPGYAAGNLLLAARIGEGITTRTV